MIVFMSEENERESKEISSDIKSILDSDTAKSRTVFEEFTDERILVSYDAFGTKQMKIKIIEVSDENTASKWKFGDRVKVTKILVTIKYLTSQEVEEREFDIEAIERELQEKRHYSSSNRWIPADEIKNGYVVGSRHTTLISDASALDYIVF
jgi:molybdenum cofactor biosynthesis enzyme MoaA